MRLMKNLLFQTRQKDELVRNFKKKSTQKKQSNSTGEIENKK